MSSVRVSLLVLNFILILLWNCKLWHWIDDAGKSKKTQFFFLHLNCIYLSVKWNTVSVSARIMHVQNCASSACVFSYMAFDSFTAALQHPAVGPQHLTYPPSLSLPPPLIPLSLSTNSAAFLENTFSSFFSHQTRLFFSSLPSQCFSSGQAILDKLFHNPIVSVEVSFFFL